jgi:hypothetical protein
MRTIELHKLDREARTPNHDARFRDTDDVGENGGEAGVVVEIGPQSSPVVINVDAIRCFYPRTQERSGTRITFTDGGGFAVIEAFDDVKAQVAAASASA